MRCRNGEIAVDDCFLCAILFLFKAMYLTTGIDTALRTLGEVI